jgi:putative DNA primase/helicase
MLSDDPVDRRAIRCWLISAAARIYQPGCQADLVLVLAGQRGGEGKSSTLRTLFGKWHRSGLPAKLDDPQKAGQALLGNWGIELGELVSVRKSDKETLKDYITRTHDKFRLPYERSEETHARQCVFAGTCNDLGFLDKFDTAFRRRFYGIEIKGPLDVARVRALRNGIWAEARDAHKAGEAHWLEAHELQGAIEARQVKFDATDVLDDLVTAHLAVHGVKSLDGATATEIYVKIAPRENGYPSNVILNRLGDILRDRKFSGPHKSNGRKVFKAPSVGAANDSQPTEPDPQVRTRIAEETATTAAFFAHVTANAA